MADEPIPGVNLKHLPTWAYGAIAGGLTLVGVWWYRKHEASLAAAAAAPVAMDTSGLTNASLASGDVGGTAMNGNYPSSSSGAPTFASNALWETQGVGWATTQGYSPLEAQLALEAYISGGTLDSTEQLIVNAVIAKFGIPPDGISGPVTTVNTLPTATAPTADTAVTPAPTSYGAAMTPAQSQQITNTVLAQLAANPVVPAHTVTQTQVNAMTPAQQSALYSGSYSLVPAGTPGTSTPNRLAPANMQPPPGSVGGPTYIVGTDANGHPIYGNNPFS